MARQKRPAEQFLVRVDSGDVPVDVFYERRRGVRASSGKNAVLLRIPSYSTEHERQGYKDWCAEWIHKQWEGNPRFRATYTKTDYASCHAFRTFDARFDVVYSYTGRATGKARMNGTTIDMTLPDDLSQDQTSDLAYRLMHKVLANHYHQEFSQRIQSIHDGFFSKPVASISLKNMSSKWGSCNSDGNLSLSTRLIFAPQHVQDYVFLHELCHLDELNHSADFWNLVARFNPQYEQQETWLRDHGHTCDINHHMESRFWGQLELPFADLN